MKDFVKSTRSTGSQACVEWLISDEIVVVRDSKDTSGPVLTFTHAEWEAFIGAVKDGEADL